MIPANIESAMNGSSSMRLFYSMLSTLLTASIVLLCFCPPFSAWRWLHPRWHASPAEVNRGFDVLRQLNDPSIHIDTTSNLVLNWRLLFPSIGYWLGLSPALFLALPHVGCLLVIFLVTDQLAMHSSDRLQCWISATLLATTSWFFVSTGWLGYFDSWLALGLLTPVCYSSRLVLFAATLLAPWIDERYLLSLPLIMLLRLHCRLNLSENRYRSLAFDLLVAMIGMMPYVTLRTHAIFLGSDYVASNYFHSMPSTPIGLSGYLQGCWFGLRWVILLFPWFLTVIARRDGYSWGILIGITTTLVLCVNLLIAGDLSRSVTALMPFTFASLRAISQHPQRRWRYMVTGGLLAVNLLSPARHVILVYTMPIYNAFIELDSWRDPTPLDQAALGVWRAKCLLREGDLVGSQAQIAEAIRACPDDVEAQELRLHILRRMRE